uniref:ER lumen protein-retaining receptor C28H8.4 n=1 Tax=Ananas comosus var. bracteatus TaxID=296719 RepID=A0A6V7NHY7_ANACO|nr:unnamed protein product [Ananas comosus var. bracteatus]
MGSDAGIEKRVAGGRARALGAWLRRRRRRTQAAVAAAAALAAVALLGLVVTDHDLIAAAAEAVHAAGVGVLVYKLFKEGTCAGNALTLDAIGKLKRRPLFDVAPCALLAVFIHPSSVHTLSNRFLWAFSVYLEAFSVLPQLRVMQNTKIVEPFTAHYVFALGVARFLNCAYCALQFFSTLGFVVFVFGHGPWPGMVLIAEIVQTIILADFCYYYVKSFLSGDLVLRIPSNLV